MKSVILRIILGFSVIFIFSSVQADESFDSFDTFEDEESGFVIETVKPKVIKVKDFKVEKVLEGVAIASNDAVTLSIKNSQLMSKLKNIDARYLLLDLEFKNILKSQKVVVSNGSKHPSSWVNKSSDEYEYKEAVPLYLIPNLKQHLYLRVNNSNEKPIDSMSLLLDEPLMEFNSNQVEVEPTKLKLGQIAFRLPKGKNIEQLSLHYYDTKYGNIDLAILGDIQKKSVAVTSLPTSEWKSMSENFALTVTGYERIDTLGDFTAKKDATFEVVEIDIQSKVYALLEFEPSKRFYLNVGDKYSIKLHPITQAIPMGLYNSPSLSPGSHNKFRLAFYVPKGIEKLNRSLIVDLQGEDIEVPIKQGITEEKAEVLASSSAFGAKVEVNGVYAYNNKLVADVTFIDEDDDYSTRTNRSFRINGIDSEQSNRVLGYKNREVILNSRKMRKFIWFNTQYDDSKENYLTSGNFMELKYKIEKEPKPLPEYLKYVLTREYKYINSEDSVDMKVMAMIKELKLKKVKEISSKKQHVVKLERIKEKSRFKTIATISAGDYGKSELSKFKTVDELVEALKTLKWVPSAYDVTEAIYSTASTFTQGWGSENEMFRAVYDRVKELNVKFGSYALSDNGKKELSLLAKNIPLSKNIPFIEWAKDGKEYSLVFPFLKPTDEVKSFVTSKKYLTNIKKAQATIEMTLTYKPKNDGTASKSFGMFGGALNGATSSEKIETIFKKSWSLDEISDTPIDIYFPSTIASYTDAGGIYKDKENALSSKKVEPKLLTINITMPDGKLDTYSHYFEEKQELKDIFFTIALASPDMAKNALTYMNNSKKKLFYGIKNITEFSTLQWLNRDKIYKFIGIQSIYEKDLSKELTVQHTRNLKVRTIIAKVERKTNKRIVSTIDLRSVYPSVYGSDDKVKSFNIISGILATQSEKSVLDGINVFDIWENTESLQLFTIMPSQKSNYIEYLKINSTPKNILDRLEKSTSVWIFPDRASKSGRYGWLEIDPNSYRLISVLDTGEYGAMTETVITQTHIETTTRYFLGLLIGSNIAVGSVIDMALITADYIAIKKDGHRLAKVIGCYVKKFEAISGSVKKTVQDAAKGEAKNQAKGAGGDFIDNMIKDTLDCKDGGKSDGKKPKEYKDMINFGKGIDQAISNYFKNMK